MLGASGQPIGLQFDSPMHHGYSEEELLGQTQEVCQGWVIYCGSVVLYAPKHFVFLHPIPHPTIPHNILDGSVN